MKLSVALVVLFAWRIAFADEASLLAGLETEDRAALSDAITAIEHAPATPALADVLFAAGRASEDRLHDPARALALYERIVHELPDAGISIAAGRRIAQLQGVRGHAREAAELADLVANADRLSREEVERRTGAVIKADWPGAADAALWLADWHCRTARFSTAQTHYAELLARWPNTEQARLALRNAAGCAIDGRDWTLAEQLAQRLPALDPIEAAVKDDLLDAAARGRRREHLYTASWLGLVLAVGALLASFADAVLRGGRRRPALRPPVEVVFLAPVAAVIIAASFTAHRAIGPAVLRISLVGLALSWLSGATLELLRSRNRAVRTRAIVHVAACAIGVLAVGYIAITHDGLLDMLAETVRFGPGA